MINKQANNILYILVLILTYDWHNPIKSFPLIFVAPISTASFEIIRSYSFFTLNFTIYNILSVYRSFYSFSSETN